MPGERLDAALQAARKLADSQVLSVLTLLGENIDGRADAEAVTTEYLSILENVGELGIPCQISVKPTQLGMDLSRDLCHEQLKVLLESAHRTNNFVWVDMESSEYVDSTLELVLRARESNNNIGVCLQAYLYRTGADLDRLLDGGTSVRLVKGAYREPASVAFPRKKDVDENYLVLARKMLDVSCKSDAIVSAFATHDIGLVEQIRKDAAVRELPSDRYEIQMLYGIAREPQLRLAESGNRVRVLISYGSAWFPWYMRRLAERPANVWFVVKSALAS